MPESTLGSEGLALPVPGGAIVTVGTFDGMHRGHQDVLARLVATGRAKGIPSVLVTFEPHPLEVVNPAAAPPLLTTWEERLEVLVESGLDYAVRLPFTAHLARYSPRQFVDLVLRRRFGMTELLMGYDHGFGQGRAGGVDTLRALGASGGFVVDVVPPVLASENRPISATWIRRAIAGGDLAHAAAALGRLYSVSGRVVRGAQRGRELGFPTLNVPLPPPRKLLPPEGVYAVRVQTPRGPFGGMMNLGPRPTFNEAAPNLEVHLFDASVELYGAYVRIEFVERLRGTQRFEGAEALKAQLRHDEAAARTALTLLDRSPIVPSP